MFNIRSEFQTGLGTQSVIQAKASEGEILHCGFDPVFLKRIFSSFVWLFGWSFFAGFQEL